MSQFDDLIAQKVAETESAAPAPKPRRDTFAVFKNRGPWLRIVLIAGAVIIVAAIIIFFMIPTNTDTGTDPTDDGYIDPNGLTIDDLDDPETVINGDLSDASVNNLSKQLKAKIDEQIANGENPIDTVRSLIGVLCNSANASRATQCVDYIKEFIDTKIDTLNLPSEDLGQPDEFQITRWRAQFYIDIASNYQFIMINELPGADGQPWDTTTEQIEYIDLYLEIAQNKANWGPPQTNDEGRVWYFYEYNDVEYFVEWRNQLQARTDAQ